MSNFLTLLEQEYGEKYSYIRVKSAEVFKMSKKVNITLLIPEDIFDYEFEKEDILAIKTVLDNAINGKERTSSKYKINLFFDRIYFDEDILISTLIDFIKANYPFVGSNIDFERMRLSAESEASLLFVMQESIYDYASKSDFEPAVKKFFEDKYCIKCSIDYEIVDNVIEEIPEESSSYRSIFIPVGNVAKLCGKGDFKGALPKHISALNKAGDNISICGRMTVIDRNIWDEDKAVEGKKFYKFHYIISVDDTSDSMRVLYNTNDENCPIETLKEGTEVIMRGRVFYKEDTGRFIMFAKTIGTCDIDFDTVKAQLEPLPAPEKYREPPLPYQNSNEGAQMSLLFDDEAERQKPRHSGEVIAMHCLTLSKANERIIYEIACIRLKDGKPLDYYHTYLKTAKHDSMNLEAKAKVGSAPRLSSVIPDLVKFTLGKTIVALDVFNMLKALNEVAKPLRYVFQNEVKEILSYAAKGKADNFFAMCRDNGIRVSASSTAFEYAQAVMKLYLNNT